MLTARDIVRGLVFGAVFSAIVSSSEMAPAQTAPGFAIAGTVTSAEGTAIAGVHLSATSDKPCGKEVQMPVTDSAPDGNFSLRIPCAGIWRLGGSATGYGQQLYEQHGSLSTGIVLSASQPSFQAAFRMTGNGSISGTVLDEVGDPIRNAAVVLFSAAGDSGTSQMVDSATTDIRGIYEFEVAAGTYKIAVKAQPWYAVAAQKGQAASIGSSVDASIDVSYPTTYYPAATDAGAASEIEVAGGASQEADVHLSPVPAIHVKMPGADRRSVSFGVNGQPIPQAATAPLLKERTAFGSMPFEPTAVTLLPDGSIDVDGFTPGSYSVPSAPGHQQSEQQMMIARDSERSVTLDRVTVKSAVEQRKDTAGASLSGAITFAEQPCAGCLIILVSIGDTSNTIRRQQSNTDGTFNFLMLPQGKYILAGVKDGWGLPLQDVRTLGALLQHGVPIDLRTPLILRDPLRALAP